MAVKEYFLVFDTNVLYQNYSKKADFTTFSFNSTYQNTLGIVNQLDIYENVTIAIPEVIWSEMTKQIIDSHESKCADFKTYIQKWQFPEYSIRESLIEDYSTYIEEKVDEYKVEILSGINNIISLPLPSDDKFKRIVKRAFDKEPPFGGKEKNSDKGFKDVLLWESILEFITSHPYANLLFYTKDNGFKESLMAEFNSLLPHANIVICSCEDEVKEQLESWAKEIDIYAYQPIIDYKEHQEFIDWLESGDCTIQLVERDFGLIEKSRIITEIIVKVLDYDNIQVTSVTEEINRYSVDASLEVTYSFKSEIIVSETIEVNMEVESFDDTVFSVEDVYRTDEVEVSEESEA